MRLHQIPIYIFPHHSHSPQLPSSPRMLIAHSHTSVAGSPGCTESFSNARVDHGRKRPDDYYGNTPNGNNVGIQIERWLYTSSCREHSSSPQQANLVLPPWHPARGCYMRLLRKAWKHNFGLPRVWTIFTEPTPINFNIRSRRGQIRSSYVLRFCAMMLTRPHAHNL